MRKLLIRAIVTGFGLRIGSELGKLVARRVFPQDDDKTSKDDEEDDDGLMSNTPDPPEV